MNQKLLLSLLFILQLHFLASGQDLISFRQLSINDGLSQNSAISIAQDSIGYLWIATQDGLNKYDGRKFKNYPFLFLDITRPNFSHLGKVYVDRKGAIWCIPSSRKLNRLNDKADKFIELPEISDASIIYQDSKSTYWVGTNTKGLVSFNMDEDHPKDLHTIAIQESIYSIKHFENLLLVATDKGVLQVDIANRQVKDTLPTTFLDQDINKGFSTIAVEKEGRQWFGTYGAGLYYRDGTNSYLKSINNLPLSLPIADELNILSLFIDSKNRLWVGTYGNGLYMIHLDSFESFHFIPNKFNPKAIHYSDILSIYEDYTGTIWFGTDGAGLSYYDEYLEKFNSITNYQVPENINVDVIRAIEKDVEGSIWLGTSGNGLVKYLINSNSWISYKKDNNKTNSLLSDRIMSLYYDDSNSDLWIGTQGGGLSILDMFGTFKNYIKEKQLNLDALTIWDIHKDQQDQFWLATRQSGLIQFDKKKGTINNFNEQTVFKEGRMFNNITVIEEGENGTLWLGTESDGLLLFNPNEMTIKNFQTNATNNSISSNKIKSIYLGQKETLWIGTNGNGLDAYVIDANKFYNYSENDGLPNNVIYSILPDNKQDLWLSSNRGITHFVPKPNLIENPVIHNYTNYDGLATEFNTGAGHTAKDGNLYFGGLDGFYWFKPVNIKKNTQLPKTVITDMFIANEPFDMSNSAKLGPQQHTLSFTFSSLQFSLPKKNEYQYKLMNYDDEWIHAGNTNFARYSFLPAGDYQFKVKSSNYDGIWNNNPAHFSFSIAPDWYLTLWAKLAYVLLLIATAYWIYSYLKWRWSMKLNLQLTEKEAQRLKHLNKFKSQLYTDISHEFRTPLTLISAPIDAKLGEGNLSDFDFANFSMVKRNTNRLIALVDQLLHLAKLEKGKIKLKISKGNLGLFLGALASSFTYRAALKNIDYNVDIGELDMLWHDEDTIEKIITNLLSNAFKYCPEYGTCSFTAQKLNHEVQMDIKNTIDKSSEINLDKIFTRFYQNDEYTEGAGIGLSLVKELIELYNGKITVRIEEENQRIHFMVLLPAERSLFKKGFIVEHTKETKVSLAKNISETVSLQPDDTKKKCDNEELPILLIVEDHKEVVDFLISVWKNKYQIFTANNGKIGIKTALEIIPDLIISDVRMPVYDGVQLCNTLKMDERTSHIPIILLTAGLSEEAELKGLQSGADDFITKPFKLRILDKRVENLLASRKALRSRYNQENIVQVKDIAITPTDEIFLNKLQKILDENLSDTNFNATFLSKQLHMSRMQLHRKLLAYTGHSTSSFIRLQRLKQAVQILKTSDATINEVGYTVGFNTPSYFIKCFKETYKKTPLEYLKSEE